MGNERRMGQRKKGERTSVLAVGEGYKSHGYDGYDGRERNE